MQAEIISIGDELLIGQVVNTNASWLGVFLNSRGFRVARMVTVGDSEAAIRSALENSLPDTSLVIITGGLGPTSDDRTKNVLSLHFGMPLKMYEPARSHIQELFERRGIRLTPANLEQALLPEGCLALPNEEGTAYGICIRRDKRVYAALPGVPYEMETICRNHLDRVISEIPGAGKSITHRTLLTTGVPESILAEMIEAFENSLEEGISLAYLPSPGMVRLRLTTFDQNLAGRLEDQFRHLEMLLKDHVIGSGEDTLEIILGRLLREKGYWLAAAESCTGGYISHLLTSVSGSSGYFRGGAVAYDNDVKTGWLGVREETLRSFGAVSRETALEMVEGVCFALNSETGIAVTGIAGPGGGSPQKPVGTTWIAVKVGNKVDVKMYSLGGTRMRNIQRAAVISLGKLIRMLRSD